MKLLHIVATPRGPASNTLRISAAFLARLQAVRPDIQVTTINVFEKDLPAVSGDAIEAKYTLLIGQPLDKAHAESWRSIEAVIAQFLAADVYLITTPMWNFNIPYALKFYIDALVQPGYLFTYNDQGYPVGLATGKQMVCITSRGGDYTAGSPIHSYDLQEPYLRTIFGFCGITDIQFVSAQPTDITPELREQAITTAIGAAEQLAERWPAPAADAPAS